jgi:hypothetical protein
MRSTRSIIQITLATLVPAVILFVLGYLCLAAVGLAWTPWTCIAEQRKVVTNLHGIDFEVTETNCDVLAKDDVMRVLVSKTGGRRKVSILEFDPVGWAPLPQFSVSDDGKITVAVEKMGAVLKQQDEWNGISIHYKIGHIYDPITPPPPHAAQQDKP